MYLRTLLIALVLGIVAILAFLNWNVFMTRATLSVGFTTVEAPLGLLLLGIIALLTVMFLVYIVYLQSSMLVESRRFTRELQAQRELAENAEASRFLRASVGAATGLLLFAIARLIGSKIGLRLSVCRLKEQYGKSEWVVR